MNTRRNFLSLLGAASATAALPLPLRAQRQLPVIGFLNGQSAGAFSAQLADFKSGLAASGFVEGVDVAIEYRWADGQTGRLNDLLADLVKRRVTVLVLSGGTTSITKIAGAIGIPVVTTFARDPQKDGYVDSLNRPGGYVTGINLRAFELESKRLGLLHEMVPAAKSIALLATSTAFAADQVRDAQDAATRLGLTLRVLHANTPSEIDDAFAALARTPADALHVSAAPFFNGRRSDPGAGRGIKVSRSPWRLLI